MQYNAMQYNTMLIFFVYSRREAQHQRKEHRHTHSPLQEIQQVHWLTSAPIEAMEVYLIRNDDRPTDQLTDMIVHLKNYISILECYK